MIMICKYICFLLFWVIVILTFAITATFVCKLVRMWFEDDSD